jgi:hypothetical protein
VVRLYIAAAGLTQSKDELRGSRRTFVFAHPFVKDEYPCAEQGDKEDTDVDSKADAYVSRAAHLA